MFKISIILLLIVTISYSSNKSDYKNDNDFFFPNKIYSNNQKINENEIFPTKVILTNDDVYVNTLKNYISNKFIDKQSIEKESYDFLMCFIFDIKEIVKNESNFKSFKSEPKYLNTRQKIVNDCVKQSNISEKNFNKFINIINEI